MATSSIARFFLNSSEPGLYNDPCRSGISHNHCVAPRLGHLKSFLLSTVCFGSTGPLYRQSYCRQGGDVQGRSQPLKMGGGRGGGSTLPDL